MASLDRSVLVRTAVILVGVSVFEGAFIVANPDLWIAAAFKKSADVNAAAWLLSAAVTLAYIAYSVRGLPQLARLLPLVSPFKLLAVVIAVPSGILEEVFFRNILMDALAAAHQSSLVQIAGSAAAFGVAHAFWGIRGGWRAVTGAVLSTTLLGLGLAVVYLTAGRIVFPCVFSHFAINMVLEPWLMYAYIDSARRGSVLAVAAGSL